MSVMFPKPSGYIDAGFRLRSRPCAVKSKIPPPHHALSLTPFHVPPVFRAFSPSRKYQVPKTLILKPPLSPPPPTERTIYPHCENIGSSSIQASPVIRRKWVAPGSLGAKTAFPEKPPGPFYAGEGSADRQCFSSPKNRGFAFFSRPTPDACDVGRDLILSPVNVHRIKFHRPIFLISLLSLS